MQQPSMIAPSMIAFEYLRSSLLVLGVFIAMVLGSAVAVAETAAPEPAYTTAGDYILGSGDKIRIIVFGEQELSGEFDVSGSGKLSMPLIGQVQAAGLTLAQLESEIATSLSDGYLTNPRVSAEVLNYRPFYIIGEVSKAGQYPYTNGMTVLNAVAVAGGFTYRANSAVVFISRNGAPEQRFRTTQDLKVLPGDTVRIPERFF